MKPREPMRSERTPAIGATIIVAPVHSSMRSPAWNGRVAQHVLQHLGEQEDRAEGPEVHEERHGVGDREGALAEEAHRDHRLPWRAAPRRRRPPAGRCRWPATTTISGVVQPSACPRTRPKTSAKRPTEARPKPGRSSVRDGPWLSLQHARGDGSRARPMGTLIQKIQCQEMPSTTAPPTIGPSATPVPLMPDQMPSAAPRRSAGKASASRVRVSGATIAPPTPCSGAGGDERAGGRAPAPRRRSRR